MARLNKEEYEILKTYISEEKYIAKGRDGSIRLLADYPERDMKREGWSDGWGKSTLKNSANNFQFIQWEDEEPYEIAELIREYKIKELRIAPSGTVIVDSFNESEEKEVKKNKEWLRNEIKNLQVYTNNPTFGRFDQIRLWDVEKLIDQMDEPEVLSKEWIDNNSVNASHDGVTDEYVHVDDLKNLLVPKQEEVKRVQIPEWIIEWYQGANNKYSTLEDVFSNLSHDTGYNIMDSEKFRSRIMEYGGFSKMYEALSHIYFGVYEIEEEQKYYVLNEENELILGWSQSAYMTPCIEGYEYMKHNGRENLFQLTEQEIKDYDSRYWTFAAKVEEVE